MNKTQKCSYRERKPNGEITHKPGTCDHPESDHRNGTCHHVLDIKKNGTVVYCFCVLNKGNHKSFAELGYLEPVKDDWMMPKNCVSCDDEVTLHIDEVICSPCKSTRARKVRPMETALQHLDYIQ